MKLIYPKDIIDTPTDPIRIGPILYELRGIWLEEPHRTLGEVLRRIVETEYNKEYLFTITDDELLAALQNYGEMGSI